MPMNPRLLRPSSGSGAAPCAYPASLLLHFDGNFTDSSENGLTVTPYGDAATTTAQSRFGGSSLNPDGGYLQVGGQEPFAVGSGDWTIEAWVRLDFEPTSGQALVSKAIANVAITPGNNGLSEITFNAGGDIRVVLAATADFGAGWLDAHFTAPGGTLSPGTWRHIAVCRSGERINCFWDGQLIGSEQYGTHSIYPSDEVPLLVGARFVNSLSGQDQHFVGYIDELRITKGLAVYDCAFTPPSAPLSACVTPVPVSRPASLLMHFDGNFTDSSVNGLTVTPNGDAATTAAQSKFGGYSLNPDGGHLEVPYDPLFDFGTADFTIEFFIRPDSVSTQQIPLSIGGYPNGAEVYIGGGGLGFACDDGGGWSGFNGSQDATAGEWNHCACVRSAGMVTLYLDGVPVGSSSTYGGALSANSGPVWIGSREGANAVVGYIDDLRVVKGLAVYKGPFTPPTAPLSAIATPQPVNASLCLNFDGNFIDESVNGLTVTAVGGASISTAQAKFGSGSLTGGHCTAPYSDLFSMNGDFTIEAWIYPLSNGETVDSVAFNMVYSHSGAADAYGAVLLMYNGSISFLRASESGGAWDTLLLSLSAVATNQWSHVAVVRRADTTSVYLNGTLVGSATTNHNTGAVTDVNIGHYPVTNGYEPVGFDGYIDGVRFTKAALYCDEFTPPTAPPTPTAVPPCCVASAPPPPSCDPYGTFITVDCNGCDFGTWYADGECGQYFDAWAPGACC